MTADIILAQKVCGVQRSEIGPLVLRPLCEGDAERLYQSLSRSGEASWERVPASRNYVAELLRFRLSHYERYGFGILAVEAPDGELVGQGGVQVFNEDLDQVEVVMFLDDTYTGAGIGTIVLTELLRRARCAGMARLYAAIRTDNIGAQRFFSRFEFRFIEYVRHFGQDSGLWVNALGTADRR